MNDEQGGGIVIGSVGGDLSFQAGGDIVAGNKTIINNIIQRIAKELTTTPYKFLASYDIADRDIFYGRDPIIEELAAQVGRHKVILINGASGSGKSSLVNAGLIPRVADNGYTFVAFREYSDPLAQLQAYFDTAHSPSPPQAPTKTADGQGSLLQLIRGFGASPMVIFLDQFERFFVRVADDKRRAFMAAFSHCLRYSDAKDLCFILAFRREFLGQLMFEVEQQIPEFINEAYRINLLPLNLAEAREAIVRPLENTSLKIQYDEDFVDNVLLAGLAEQTSGGASIDPPHLQIVCNQLFEAARQRLQTRSSVLINRALYDELGGAQNILNTYLDKVVEDVAQDPERIDVVHSILKTMVDAGTNTRIFVAKEGFDRALPDVNEAEILKFVEKLLDRRVVEERKPTYSLSHEHMVGKVKEWFDPRELERKRAEETLDRGMMEWKNSGALLNRGQVERIRKWLPDPSQEERELLQASEKNYAEEERKEAARRKLKKISLYGAVAFAVTVMILGTFSFLQMRKAVTAKDQALRNQSRALAASAKIEAERAHRRQRCEWHSQPCQKTLQRRIEPTRSKRKGRCCMGYSRARIAPLSPRGSVSSVAFSPDGRTLATGSEDMTARLWEVATGREIAALRGHENPVSSVAFSPDGRTLATGSHDKTARLWEVATGREIAALRGHEDSVSSVAFSPDGRTLATGSADKTARLWEVATGREIAALRGHEDQVSSVAFSPDGRTLATGSADKTARLWEVATGREIAALRGHEDWVSSVAFSPDGRTLATGSGTRRRGCGRWRRAARSPPCAATRIGWRRLPSAPMAAPWPPALGQDGAAVGGGDGPRDRRLARPRGRVSSVAFSPDGRTLATGSWDKTARLWEVATGREIAALRGHEDPVSVGCLQRRWPHPGHRLSGQDGAAVGGGDGPRDRRLARPRGWGVVGCLQPRWPHPGHRLYGQDGAAVGGGDGPRDRRLARPRGSGGVGRLQPRWPHPGHRLCDKTARLWEVATGREIAALRGHEDGVSSVAFSPDGRTLATGSEDKTARLWPVAQGLIDRACARVHDLPLSDEDKQRFGIEKEWCTPEVSAELRTKLGLDRSKQERPPPLANRRRKCLRYSDHRFRYNLLKT